jgi:hypothetical protein
LRANAALTEEARTKALPPPPLFFPAKFLFDFVDQHLRKKSAALRSIKRRYRPDRSPIANLPGGKMNAGQRQFVDKIWGPALRPWLIAAGFRRLTAIA